MKDMDSQFSGKKSPLFAFHGIRRSILFYARIVPEVYHTLEALSIVDASDLRFRNMKSLLIIKFPFF